MNKHYNYRILFLLFVLAFFLQKVSFAQFATNGTAVQTSTDCYRLTANTPSQGGSIFNTTPVDFSADFAVSGVMNFGNNDGGADGMSFILTNSTTALGNGGGDIGYGGILASVIIEFDTWQNAEKGDPVQDHIGITSAGQSTHTGFTALSAPVPLSNLENGQDHCFTITWSAATQTLTGTINGGTVSYTGNIPALFFSSAPNVFYGFTSSTGGASNEHTICFEEPILTPMQDQQICQGESVVLQADPNGNSYTWSPNPTLSSFNISNPIATPPITTLYNVTVGFDCGSPVVDDVLVTVLPAPTTVALSNSPLCTGATLELNAIGTGTYSWTGPNGFNSNLQNPTIPNITSANAGEYILEIEGPNGCEGSATVTVIVFPSIVFIFPQPPLCQNDTQIQFEATPTGGTWGGVADANGFVYPSALATGMHTITYSVASGNGCPGMDEIMIEVLPAGTIDITSPIEFCVSETNATLTATPSGGVWGGVATAFGEVNPQFLGVGMHTVTYAVGDANCNSETTFMIEVIGQTSVDIMSDAPYCADESIQTLTANVTGGTWGGVANEMGNINPTALGAGFFEVTYTTTGSCPGTAQYFFDVNAIPTASLGEGGSFCTESTGFPMEIILTGNSPINITYTIDDASPTNVTLNSGTTILNITTAGTYEITAITDANGCSGMASNAIEILEAGAPQLVSLEANCNATQTEYQLTFEVNGGDSDTYMVASAIGGSFSPNPPYIFTSDFIPSGDTYTFLITDTNQCETLEVTGDFVCQCSEVTGTNAATICDGESILLAGAMQDSNGMYLDTLISFSGCDSILTTTLTILQTDTIFLPDSFTCDPNNVGTFSESFTNQTGCDSTEIVNIILSNSQTYTVFSTTCNAGEEGVFTNEFVAFDGCDSIVVETVSLLESDTIFLPDSFTCDPDNVGTFSESFTNQAGCDSTEIVNIILSDSQTYTVSSTTCNAGEEGVFTNEFVAFDGCDSIVVETVSLLESDTIFLPDSFTCDPNNVGTFSESFTNQAGCDSTEIVNIILSDSQTYTVSSTTCNAGEEGVFTNEFVAFDGCDSIVVETVSLLESDTIFLPDSFTCDPNNVGTFSESFTNQAGCDSTEIVNIILSDSQTYTISSTTCIAGEEGVFTNEFVAFDGCDSIVVETVSLLESDTIFLPDSFTCDPNNVGTFSESFNNQAGCDSTEIVNIILSNSQTYTVSSTTCNAGEEGVFTNEFVAFDGCDSIVVETVSLLESDTIFLPDSFTCDPDNVGTFSESFTNQAGCDSTEIVNIILSDSQTYTISSTTCNAGEEGVFTNEFVAFDGCDSIVVETVSLLESDTIFLPNSFTCDPNNVGTFSESFTNQAGCDSTTFSTINLAPTDLINIPLTTCNPDEVGEITTLLINQFGCDSILVETTILLPQSDCGVGGTVVGSTIPCEENTGYFSINIEFGQSPFDISWTGTENGTGTIDNIAENVDFTNLPSGIYQIIITDTNDFSTTLTTEILQNIPPSLTVFATSNYNSFEISCNGENDGSSQVNATNGQAPYDYFWSNGETTNTIEDLPAGPYSVTVTDALDCVNEANIFLTEPDDLSLTFEISDLDCFGQNSGAIVAEVTGGVPPYSFILNDIAPQESNIFTGLTNGVFTISVEDANGCTTSEIIGVNAPLDITVNLGMDLNIDMGDNAGLVALTNIDNSMIDSVDWIGIDSSECPECLTQFIAPLFTTTYSVNITAENGCSGSDDLTVYVDRSKNIYVPTAFAPESASDLNNILMIFAADNTIVNISEFKIISRWGDILFDAYDFLPNDPGFGWNGNFKNQPMNTGVYVWYAVIEFVDGENEVFKGDVTLIR